VDADVVRGWVLSLMDEGRKQVEQREIVTIKTKITL
jgi:hypothetical protein